MDRVSRSGGGNRLGLETRSKPHVFGKRIGATDMRIFGVSLMTIAIIAAAYYAGSMNVVKRVTGL